MPSIIPGEKITNTPGPRPIPGPVPDAFFRNVPSSARAAFSTLDGQRLPRPSPGLDGAFSVRSNDDDTIHQRALSLLKSYPRIACSVTKPLAVWEDLYEYFDAYDLWMESPGVLFQVMGQIAKINFARDKEIALYATEWVYNNAARLAILPQGQDVISSIFTKEDEQFFDLPALTPYEKLLLARTLNQKFESLKPKVASQQNIPRQGDSGMCQPTRHLYHYPIPEGREPPYRLSYTGHAQNEISQWIPTIDNQPRPFLKSYRQDGYSGSPGRPRIYSSKKTSQVSTNNYSMDPKPRPSPVDGFSPSALDRQDNAFNTLPPVVHPGPSRFGVYGPHPVYMLTPQVPHILQMAVQGGFRVPYPPFPPPFTHQFSLLHPRPEHLNISDREQISTCRSSGLMSPNTQTRELNGARTQPTNSSSKPKAQQAQETSANKHLGQNSCSSDNRTIWIGCISPAILQYEFSRVLSLFSPCGTIEHSRTLVQKFCAFITFECPNSVDRAIDTLDRCEFEKGKFIKVERVRKRDSKERRNSSSTCGGNKHLNNINLPISDATVYSLQSKQHCSISEIDRESNRAKQYRLETTVSGCPISTQQSRAVSITNDSSAINVPFPQKQYPSAGEEQSPLVMQSTARSGRYPSKFSSSKKKKKSLQNTESEINATPAEKNSAFSGNPLTENYNYNSTQYSSALPLNTLLSGCGSGNSKILEKCNRKNKEKALENSSKVSGLGIADQETLDPSLLESSSKIMVEINHSHEMDRRQPNTAHNIGFRSMDGLSSDNLKVSKSGTTTNNERLESMVMHDATKDASAVSSSAKKKNTSYKGRTVSTRSKITSETVIDGNSLTVENSVSKGASTKINVAHEAIDSSTSLNMISFSSELGYKTLPIEANNRSKRHMKSKSNSSSTSTVSSKFTPSNDTDSQASSTTAQPCHVNHRNGHNRVTPNSEQGSNDMKLGQKVNSGGNIVSSVRKADSATGSHLSGTRFQTDPKANNSTTISRKENEELPPFPRLHLSDLSQWPALGTSKPLLESKPINVQQTIASMIKPLSDRPLQPNLLRRGSTASVLSVSSPTARRLTNGSSGSSTGASRLWPIVKRWDGYHPIDKNKST